MCSMHASGEEPSSHVPPPGVAEQEALVLEAGSHEESVRLATDDVIRLAHAQVADVSES